MKTFTISDIMGTGPCYTQEKVRKLFAGRKSVTALDIITANIPAKDRVWQVTRPGFLSIDIRDRWLEIVVTRAVTNYALNCDVESVRKWAAKWLDGTDRTADAAGAVADTAAVAADASAAYAAYAAYAGAADTAAVAADASAAYAADTAAVAAADDARNAEYDQQIADLIALIEGTK